MATLLKYGDKLPDGTTLTVDQVSGRKLNPGEYSSPVGALYDINTGQPVGDNQGGTTKSKVLDEEGLLNAQKVGLTPDQYNQLDPTQKAIISIIGETASNVYSTTGAGVTLADAFKLASQDPDIVAKYSDALNLDTEQFKQSLQKLQIDSDVKSAQDKIQFEQDKKTLDEANAAAGTAYSGFRGKAQQNLDSAENGIITSTRAGLKKSVDDATAAFEAKYGTKATTPGAIDYKNPFGNNETITGDLAGGITGAVPLAKKADIYNSAASSYNTAQLPI